MSAGDVALACMRAFVDELVRRGVTDASIAPGSRSTPLVLALARDERIRLHVHLDERGAAFFALGQAKASGRPVIVACTSGTAAANMLPAVVEARQSGAALLVLTADRPPELRGSGANQTIDQLELYGRYPRLFVDAPVPSESSLRPWRELAARAVAAAYGEPPEPRAPVHVNLPFAEPLIPAGEEPAVTDELLADDEARRPSLESLCAADAGQVGARIAATERGVIVAGALDPSQAPGVLALAEASGWPLVAEPISNARVPGLALTSPQQLLGDVWAEQRAADLVVLVGGIPTTRAAQALVARARSVVSVSAHARAPMPGWQVDRTITTEPAAFCRALASRVPAAGESAWAKEWREADAVARAAVDATLGGFADASASFEGAPFEGAVAREVAARVPDGGALFVGSSTPVRDLDAFMLPRTGLRIYANRGASGIDGGVATALGVAASGGPCVALLGDLAFLYDASSVVWASQLGIDLEVVVVNNGGGGIFDLLPSSILPEHEQLFVAPHEIDLSRLAAAGGLRVTEVKIDRARALEQRRAVSAAVRAALA